jgi:hypothetical protein
MSLTLQGSALVAQLLHSLNPKPKRPQRELASLQPESSEYRHSSNKSTLLFQTLLCSTTPGASSVFVQVGASLQLPCCSAISVPLELPERPSMVLPRGELARNKARAWLHTSLRQHVAGVAFVDHYLIKDHYLRATSCGPYAPTCCSTPGMSGVLLLLQSGQLDTCGVSCRSDRSLARVSKTIEELQTRYSTSAGISCLLSWCSVLSVRTFLYV